MMQLVDSHTHLESFQLDGELIEALERAEKSGVGRLVTVGTELSDWGLYRRLAAEHPGVVFYTAGIHPSGMRADWEREFERLEPDFFNSEVRPVAVGEIGLDRFHLDEDPAVAEEEFARQRQAFRLQLSLAARLDLPVVIHSRGAFWECVEMVDASEVSWDRVVFHCFTEGADEIRELNERGGRGSFTGILTYKRAEEVREAALAQGIDRLMIETDAPYLAPVPYRGKRNEPAYLRAIAEFAAELFRVSISEIVERTAEATSRFYGLDDRPGERSGIRGDSKAE